MSSKSTKIPVKKERSFSEVQFWHDLAQVLPHRLSDEEEQGVIAQARTGDSQARDALLVSLIPYAKVVASTCMRLYGWATPRVEFLDLIQMGILNACEYVQRALAHPNPCGYLRLCVSYAMTGYCQRYSSLIKTAFDHESKPLASFETESLDMPVDFGPQKGLSEKTLYDQLPAPAQAQPERDFTALYEAIEQLPKRQAETITRYFGLEGEPETIHSIDRHFHKPGTTGNTCNASEYKNKALATLSRRLRVTVHQRVESTLEVYTTSQACALLGVTVDRLMYLRRKHDIPIVEKGCYPKQAIHDLAACAATT